MNSYVMFHVLFVSFALVSLVVGLPVPRRLQRVSRQAQYGIHAFPGSRLPAVACFRSTLLGPPVPRTHFRRCHSLIASRWCRSTATNADYLCDIFSPDSVSYWGSYFKYRKRCMCAFSSLGAVYGAVAVCAWELGRWCRCCVLLLCARGSLGAGAAAVCCCCARVGAWALVPLLCARGSLGAGAAAVCGWELGRWCRCCMLLLCARESLGASAAAVCMWGLGR